MAFAPSVLNIHTPTSSFALVHSFTQESLLDLYNKLSRKHNTDYYGERVGPGWLKYEYNDAIWNLDDDSDYTIFTWRHQQQQERVAQGPAAVAAWQSEVDAATTSSMRPHTPSVNVFSPPPSDATPMPSTPTLHLHDPRKPLPARPAYVNRAYYMFQPGRLAGPTSAPKKRSPAPSHASTGGKRSNTKKSVRSSRAHEEDEDDGVPRFKKQFDRFHAENGVRTVFGTIGPVHDVRMLLKTGYRHVYISRKFAIKHGFIPRDAAPGNYGYGGLVNLGKWPITLMPSATQATQSAGKQGRATGQGIGMGQGHLRPDAFPTPSSTPGHTPVSSPGAQSHALPVHEHAHGHSLLAPPMSSGKTRSLRSSPSVNGGRQARMQNGDHAKANEGPKVTTIEVYLSEEPHFDVVLGRSFIEKRRIQMNNVDPTDVVCLDTGEKIECELVVLEDGRGEIVTVT
ncbi:hypothetical protein D9619_005360 [Psilocybe cf. subviscida]|uniref:Uncharacterized protein n=1 Tax=Psilocybe cf. subviscida TaxID=2480587 RepID=A0A8H5BW50_9AGAR|nr:hypothetical protein D9619_005360 [Psilocybe cf. subviscida]